MTFKPKLFTLLKNGISKEQIFKDAIAGSIVGIVAGFIISIFGGSRVQIGGPNSWHYFSIFWII